MASDAPTGDDAEARLLQVAAAFFDTMLVEAGPGTMDVVRGLAASAAERLEQEGRENDEQAIEAAQVRMVYILTSASLAPETLTLTVDEVRAFPQRPTFLDEATLDNFMLGICPIWPFCT